MAREQAQAALSGELYMEESHCEGRRPRKIA